LRRWEGRQGRKRVSNWWGIAHSEEGMGLRAWGVGRRARGIGIGHLAHGLREGYSAEGKGQGKERS
jgi:hypothetical protein